MACGFMVVVADVNYYGGNHYYYFDGDHYYHDGNQYHYDGNQKKCAVLWLPWLT